MHRALRLRKPRRIELILGLGLLLVGACPHGLTVRAAPSPNAGSPAAAQLLYEEAQAALAQGRFAVAEGKARELLVQFPADPLSVWASLIAARAALADGGATVRGTLDEAIDRAEAALTTADSDELKQQAALVLGLGLARGRDPERARALLDPLATKVDSAVAIEVHAALAEAAFRLRDHARALDAYGRFYAGARPAEARYIRERAVEIANAIADADVAAVYFSSAPESLTRAVLGQRLAALLATTEPTRAPVILAETQAARRGFKLDATAGADATAGELRQPLIGVMVPLTGRNRLLGQHVLRGVLLGGATLPSGQSTIALSLRDSASDARIATTVVDELAAENVLAIIGSPDRQEAQAAAARAETLGIPFFALAPEETTPGERVFQLLRPNTARAEALARHVLARGVRRTATLFPDHGYGHKMEEAFATAIRSGGGEIVARVAYDAKTTTFIAPVKRIAAAAPEAIFVPTAAQQLELVAAQLYASGVTRPRSQGARGAPALLVATADGASSKLLGSVGRYLQGALLAPVFFPVDDAADGFVSRFRAAYDEEPGVADALAFDVALALRNAMTGLLPASTGTQRQALLDRLRSGATVSGASGAIGFDQHGRRSGTATVLIVDKDRVRALP